MFVIFLFDSLFFDAFDQTPRKVKNEVRERKRLQSKTLVFLFFFSENRERRKIFVLPLSLSLYSSPATNAMPLPCMRAPPRPSVSVPGAETKASGRQRRRRRRRIRESQFDDARMVSVVALFALLFSVVVCSLALSFSPLLVLILGALKKGRGGRIALLFFYSAASAREEAH